MKRSYSNSVGKLFYQKVGRLFFAVAMADGFVHTKEIIKLKTLIREKWLPLDDIEDEYGTDAAFQIEIVFDWLLENEKRSDECFEDFAEFYKQNETVFTKKIKVLIYATADSVANSFAGKNKSELICLAKLQLLFK